MNGVAIFFELTRLRLSGVVALSALIGFFIGRPQLAPESALWLTLGVGLLSGGASALNQVQERDTDALMLRTRLRPLPSGRIRSCAALAVSLLTIVSGLGLLALNFPAGAALAALASLLLYNLVYTPLKRRTPYALFPGALAGSLPPLIGWCACGGNPLDPRIVVVTGLFFLWQVPHFWLLARRHSEDYQRAGLPCFTQIISPAAQLRVVAVWVAALATTATALPALGLLNHPPVQWLLILLCLAVVLLCCLKLVLVSPPPLQFHLVPINLLMALILAGLVWDRFWIFLFC